jgi:hypothetical protein
MKYLLVLQIFVKSWLQRSPGMKYYVTAQLNKLLEIILFAVPINFLHIY